MLLRELPTIRNFVVDWRIMRLSKQPPTGAAA